MELDLNELEQTAEAADECKDSVRRLYRDAPDCDGSGHAGQQDVAEDSTLRQLLRDLYDVATEQRIQHVTYPGKCPEPATGTHHWRDDQCPACQVLMRAAASLGYVTEPCPDCAGAQHERQEAPAIGLRDCNSKNHGGQAATPQCGYFMRTTDPGCTGCVERDEDQRAEAGA